MIDAGSYNSLSLIQIMKLFKRTSNGDFRSMVRNDSLFVTIFDCFGPLYKLPK